MFPEQMLSAHSYQLSAFVKRVDDALPKKALRADG